MTDLKKDFKMHILKQMINYVAPRIIAKTKGVSPLTPQSRLIYRVWDRLEAVLAKDESTGVFDDKNFKQLLEAVKSATIFLCENDKYYKRWIGLLAFFMSEELDKMYEEFDFPEAFNMTVRPLGLTFPEFLRHKRSLWELHMSGYLYGLSLTYKGFETEIERAKSLNKAVNLPSLDSQAYTHMFFLKNNYNGFTMFFKDRDVKVDSEEG